MRITDEILDNCIIILHNTDLLPSCPNCKSIKISSESKVELGKFGYFNKEMILFRCLDCGCSFIKDV